MRLGKPIAVVDTNILVDLYSWHDWLEHFESRMPAIVAVPDLSDAKTAWRKARAREALLLALYLHKIRATTFSLSEGLTTIKELSDASTKGQWKDAFTRTFLWYVKEQLLSDWREGMKLSAAVGNAADDELLAFAKEHSLPLVTSEGYTPVGISGSNRMRKRARQAAVQVVTAADFYAGKIDEEDEANAFLLRFRKGAAGYVRAHRKQHGMSRGVEQIVRAMGNYYTHIFDPDPPGFGIKPAHRKI